MDWLESLLLGVLQGLTEFLPVSSDGHLAITQQAFARLRGTGRSGAENLFFDVMLHLGTVTAILVHYRAVAKTSLRGLSGSDEVPPAYRRNALIRVGALALVATLPLVPDALFLKKWIDQAFQSTAAAGIGFLITAAVLLLTIRLRGGDKGPEQTTWGDALLIGIAQMLAPLPGVSRSGLTIAAALGLGLSRAWAVGFSLLIAIPAILGAAVFEIKDVDPATLTPDRIAQTVVATVLAGLIGYGAILWLVKIVRSGRFWYFSVYLIVLGIVVLAVSANSGVAVMPGARRLWTGPHGAALRDRALAEAPTDPSGLWIVPSRAARDQLIPLLGRRRRVAVGLRVWCWDDLWRAIGDERADAPTRLSAVGARAALGEAIAVARRDGILPMIAEAVSFPGYRRRLQARIAAWTRAERPAEGPSPDDDPQLLEQWRIFGRYRALLKRLGAEDAEGFAVWASRTLLKSPSPQWKRLGPVTVLDLANPARANWRALESLHARSKAMGVTLAYEGDPELAEVYAGATPLRDRLLGWGFAETRVEPEIWRPAGLIGIERELFRSDAHARPELERGEGLTILGAPQGDGVGRVVARHVRRLLQRGESPDDILVLVRRLDDDAALVLETMQAWGVPVVVDSKRSLSTEPAVSALRLAMNLPVDGWETSRLVQLLRNSQVFPSWPEARPPLALAMTASALHATRVFRGLDSIRAALDRPPSDDPKDQTAADRARIARPLLERLIALLGDLARPGRWDELVARLQALAGSLRLGSTDDDALDHLWNALDDHGAVLDGLRQGDRSFSWPAFTREVEGIVRDLEVPAPRVSTRGAAVRLGTVDSAEGVRANHVILANLGEGTFPTRESVDPALESEANPTLPPRERVPEGRVRGFDFDDESAEDGPIPSEGPPVPEDESGPEPLAFAREMALFLRVVGSADVGLVLAYPTTDAKGQELLAAGFLDDVLRLFPDRLRETFHESYRRFDPALVDWPDLAGSPADARVRAVAVACGDGAIGDLVTLTRSESHRPPLQGTAAALRVSHDRFARKTFGSYDGLLRDPRAIRRIGREFGPEHRFSASQLESFVFCPFQFFLRYALALQPIDDRTELEDDYGERGSRIHRILEELHVLLAPGAGREGETLNELVPVVIGNELRSERARSSELDAGLREIERRRLERVVHRYARQHRAYEELPKGRPQPLRFEVGFGQSDDEGSPPSLELGEGAVRLQGKIDRIDLVHALEGTAFRVIDYKTGACPSKKSVHQALYLQLPLYALAVERLGLADAGATLHDVGYWSVGADGYKLIELKDWDQSRSRLETFVLEVVEQLREGVFVIDPKKDDCTRSCDYRAVCRITQVRSSGKRRDHVPSLDLDA